MRRVALAVAALVLVGVAVPIVHADPAAEARFFDARARRAYERHRWDEALRFFLESYAAAPSDGTLYNIGVTAILAGEPALGYSHLTEYLATTPEGRLADDARRRIATLEPTLALLRVESEPSGASIVVDRADLGSWGTTPRTLVVEPGVHSLTLALGDHVDATTDAAAARGTTSTVRLELVALRGSLALALEPATAVAILSREGTELARGTSGETLELDVGRWDVHVEAPGCVPVDAEAIVHEGTIEQLHVVAERVPVAMGRLLVDTGSIAARLFVDGAPRSETPAAIEIPAGAHDVRIEADGYNAWEGAIDVEEGHARFLDVTLVPR